MKKSLILSLLLLAVNSLTAQETVIASVPKSTVIFGKTTPELYGAELKLLATEDEITFAETQLAASTVGSTGEFRFELFLDHARAVFIPLDAAQGTLFVEPGKTYQVELPPAQKRTVAEQFNPYFKPAAVLLSLLNPENNDINVQIAAFEDRFDDLYLECTVDNSRETIASTIAALQRESRTDNNPFAETYKTARYALLASLADEGNPDFALSYLNRIDPSTAYGNPAFWETFNALFADFFSAFPGQPEQEDIERAIRQNDMTAMEAILEARFGMNAPLRQLVIIKSLLDLYNKDTDSDEAEAKKRRYLLSVLEEYSQSPLAPRNGKIAQAVVAKLKKTLEGEPAFNFRLPDESGKLHALTDYAGNYVYLNFANTAIGLSKQDLPVLSRYASTFKNLKVINIFLHNTAEELNRLSPELKKNCINLIGNAQVQEEYQVKNIPTYYLIDKEGRLLYSPAPSPRENFEAKFRKMMDDQTVKQLQKGKK